MADAAFIAAINGDPVAGARLLATADASLARRGQLPDPDEAAEHARLRTRLIDALGAERFRAFSAEGAGRTLQGAMSTL